MSLVSDFALAYTSIDMESCVLNLFRRYDTLLDLLCHLLGVTWDLLIISGFAF